MTFLFIVLNFFAKKQRTAGYGSGMQKVQGGFYLELTINCVEDEREALLYGLFS